MNWAQFKDPVPHTCLGGAVIACWFVAQELAGSNTVHISCKIIFEFYRFCRFYRIHLGKTVVSHSPSVQQCMQIYQNKFFKVVHMYICFCSIRNVSNIQQRLSMDFSCNSDICWPVKVKAGQGFFFFIFWWKGIIYFTDDTEYARPYWPLWASGHQERLYQWQIRDFSNLNFQNGIIF